MGIRTNNQSFYLAARLTEATKGGLARYALKKLLGTLHLSLNRVIALDGEHAMVICIAYKDKRFFTLKFPNLLINAIIRVRGNS